VTAFHAHLLRIGLWGLASIAVGALLLARGPHDAFRRQAGIQSLAWGAVNALLALAGTRGTPPSAAFLWVNVGLDAGYVGVAATLILTGRRFGSPGLRGAGWAIVPQGLFLLAADVLYLAERQCN
jgi:hypothetical protein